MSDQFFCDVQTHHHPSTEDALRCDLSRLRAENERLLREHREFRETAHAELENATSWQEITIGMAAAALIRDAKENAPEGDWHHRAHWAAMAVDDDWDVLVAKRREESNLDWVQRVERRCEELERERDNLLQSRDDLLQSMFDDGVTEGEQRAIRAMCRACWAGKMPARETMDGSWFWSHGVDGKCRCEYAYESIYQRNRAAGESDGD